MSEKRTDMVGSLSRNKKKEKETQPSHSGSCSIDGVSYWISAYVNTSRESGEKYFKLYFKSKNPTEPKEQAIPINPAELTEDAPDIPF